MYLWIKKFHQTWEVSLGGGLRSPTALVLVLIFEFFNFSML